MATPRHAGPSCPPHTHSLQSSSASVRPARQGLARPERTRTPHHSFPTSALRRRGRGGRRHLQGQPTAHARPAGAPPAGAERRSASGRGSQAPLPASATWQLSALPPPPPRKGTRDRAACRRSVSASGPALSPLPPLSARPLLPAARRCRPARLGPPPGGPPAEPRPGARPPRPPAPQQSGRAATAVSAGRHLAAPRCWLAQAGRVGGSPRRGPVPALRPPVLGVVGAAVRGKGGFAPPRRRARRCRGGPREFA